MASTGCANINTNNNNNKKMSFKTPLPLKVSALMKSTERTSPRFLRSSSKTSPQIPNKGSAQSSKLSGAATSPTLGSGSAISAGRKGMRSPQKHSNPVETPEEQRYSTVEPTCKKSTGAKSLQKAGAMCVISESQSGEVKSSTQAVALTTGVVPEIPSSSSAVEEEDKETDSTNIVPLDVFEKTGSVLLSQPDVPGSEGAPVGGGEAAHGEISKVMKQEVISGTASRKSPGQLEKQLGVEQVLEASSTSESLLEEAVREDMDDSSNDQVKVGRKRAAVKHLKQAGSTDDRPKSKRGRKPGSGKRSKLAKSMKPTVERAPGTRLKVCNNCGTVSEKSKAKKCHKCKKFFFEHWAKRCKIPPCPKCHFSRKSRQSERIPANCDRCGHPLPSSNVTSATMDAEYLGGEEEEEGEEEEVLMEFESASITSNETSTTGTNSTSEAPLSGEMMTDLEGRLKRVTEFNLEVKPQVDGGGGGQNTSEESKNPEAKDIIPTLESVAASEYGVGTEKSAKEIPSAPGSSHTGHGEQPSVAISTGTTPQPVERIPSASPPNQTEASTPSSLSPSTGSIAITRSGKVYKQDAVTDTVLNALKEKVLETQQAVLAAATKSLVAVVARSPTGINPSESSSSMFSKVLGTTSPKVSFPTAHPHLQFTPSATHQTVYAPVYTPINTFTAKASSSSIEKASSSSIEKASSSIEKASEKASSSIEKASSSIEKASSSIEKASSSIEKASSSSSIEKAGSSSIEKAGSSSIEKASSSIEKASSSIEKASSSIEKASSSIEKASSGCIEKASSGSIEKASSSSNNIDVGLQSLDKEKKTEQFSSPQVFDVHLDLKCSTAAVHDQTTHVTTTSASTKDTTPIATPVGDQATAISIQQQSDCSTQTTSGLPQTSSGLPQTTSELPQTTFRLPQTTSGLPQTTSGLPQTTSGLPQTTSGLTQTTSGLPQISSGLPQTTSGLPQTSSGLSQTTSGLPQTTSGLPQTSSGLPQTTSGLPQTTSGLPQTSSGLLQITSGLTQTSFGLPQSTSGFPQTTSGLPQTTSGLTQTSSGLPQTKSGLSQTTSELPQTSSGLPQITSRLLQTTSRFPWITSVLPQTSSVFPQTISGLPQTISGLPQTSSGLPQTSSGLPQTSSGLPQTSSVLPQTTSRLLQTTSGIPQTTSGLPQTSSGLLETTTSGLHQTTSGISETTTSEVPQTTSGLPETTSGLPQTTSGLPQTSSGLHQTTSGLPQTSSGLHQTTSVIPETTTSGLPQTSSGLPQTTSGLPQTSSRLPQTTSELPKIISGLLQTSSGLPQTTSELPKTISGLSQSSSGLPQTSSRLPQTSSGLPQTSSGLLQTTSWLPQSLSGLPQTTSGLPQITTLPDTDSMKTIPEVVVTEIGDGSPQNGSMQMTVLPCTLAETLKGDSAGVASEELVEVIMDPSSKEASGEARACSPYFSEKFRSLYGHFQNVKLKGKSKRKSGSGTLQQPAFVKKQKLSDDEPGPVVATAGVLNPSSPTCNVPQLLRYAQELGVNLHLNLPFIPPELRRPGVTQVMATPIPPSLITTTTQIPTPTTLQQQVPIESTTAAITSAGNSAGYSVAVQTTCSATTKHLPPLAPITVSTGNQGGGLPSTSQPPRVSPSPSIVLSPTLSVYPSLVHPILLQPPPPLKPSDNITGPCSLSTLIASSSQSPPTSTHGPTISPSFTSTNVSVSDAKKIPSSHTATEGALSLTTNPNSATVTRSSKPNPTESTIVSSSFNKGITTCTAISNTSTSSPAVVSKLPPVSLPTLPPGKTVVTSKVFQPGTSTVAGSNVKVSVIATPINTHSPLPTTLSVPAMQQVLQMQESSRAPSSSTGVRGATTVEASGHGTSKVVHTQTIMSSKVSAVVQKGSSETSKIPPHPAKFDSLPKASTTGNVSNTQQASSSLIDASLQIIASDVQTRIKEALLNPNTTEPARNPQSARVQSVPNALGQSVPNVLAAGTGGPLIGTVKPPDHRSAKIFVPPAVSKQPQPPSLRPTPAGDRKPSLLPKAPVVTVRLLDTKESQNWSHKASMTTVAEKLQRYTHANQQQAATVNPPVSDKSTSDSKAGPPVSENIRGTHSSSSDAATSMQEEESLARGTEQTREPGKLQARRFLTFEVGEGTGSETAMGVDPDRNEGAMEDETEHEHVGGVAWPTIVRVEGGGGEESQLSQESDRESEGYFKLVSEEMLDSESDHTSEGGSNNSTDNRQKDSSGGSGQGEGEGRGGGGKGRGRKKRDGGSGAGGGGEQWEGGGGSGSKRKRKSLSGGSHKKMDLYSVKLKDCFFHHVMWDDSRMVLIVPLTDTQDSAYKDTTPQERKPVKSEATTSPNHRTSGGVQSGGGEGGTSGERKRRRKAKLEPLVQEVEEDLGTFEESPSTSNPITVQTPCFSVYELRHKLFSTYSSSAVYVYTYKNQIKSFRPPLHWVYVLKRMGGMQESCHTCRMLEVDNVKGMCEYYAMTMPTAVDGLCRNELPRGRKVIDLSYVDPEDLNGNDLEHIPFCSFFEKLTKKKRKTHKRSRKSREVSPKQELEQKEEQEEQGEEEEEEEDGEEDEGEPHYVPQRVGSSYVGGSARVRSPPPLIKHSSPPVISRKPSKKKPCPHCGTPVLRKCKKCPMCLKTFGVFTFGRRQCVYCGRVNLARMPSCVDCGQSMSGAPIAMPKAEDSTEGESPLVRRLDFMFGVRKRRRVRSVPLPFPSGEGPGKSNRHQSIHYPSNAETECSAECTDVFQGEEEEEEGEDGELSGAATPAEVPVQKGVRSKHAGYQYGRIPWADADIMVLVDERGVPKFCLQELCSKVLLEHVKSEVFEMVKDLKLPMESGDSTLLKKLQALGLHSNRSPMCRLIAAEDLWALLDALQEPVPEEVYQHLENINTSTTPLVSPGVPGVTGVPVVPSIGVQSPAAVHVAGGPGVGGMLEEDEHGFESTLHEVACSDGQYISILRAWNGEEYACLPEVWRKYFPEVNRNHLTSVLKRLELETHMPTGQQATLLRSAGVISLRGAPGRLMMLEDLQMLLDDFGIPLQIGTSSTSDVDTVPPKQPQPPIIRPRALSTSAPATVPTTPHNRTLTSLEDLPFAECMRNLLVAVEEEDLRRLLERSQENAMDVGTLADQESLVVRTELDAIQQLMQARRDLCNVLSKEIGFLTATTHGYMAEVIRLSHVEKQALLELDLILGSMNISLL